MSQSKQSQGHTLLKMSGVSKSFKSRSGIIKVLKGLDLQAQAGEVTVLLGPNGAGKSTALAIAQGLEHADAGTVELLGENPWRAGANLRSQVGVMLQDGGLPPSLTASRLLRHLERMYKHSADASTVIGQLEIGPFADTQIRRLSGGQKQRVALAASLMGRPRLVFLDEPSAGLDPVSRKIVFDLIVELKAQGTGIVLTTHLLDDAEKLADHVVLLSKGVVERSGTVRALTSSPNSLPLEFVTESLLSDESLRHLPDHLTVRLKQDQSDIFRWSISGLSSSQDLVEVTTWWREQGIQPIEISMKRRSLEDVFWELSDEEK